MNERKRVCGVSEKVYSMSRSTKVLMSLLPEARLGERDEWVG